MDGHHNIPHLVVAKSADQAPALSGGNVTKEEHFFAELLSDATKALRLEDRFNKSKNWFFNASDRILTNPEVLGFLRTHGINYAKYRPHQLDVIPKQILGIPLGLHEVPILNEQALVNFRTVGISDALKKSLLKFTRASHVYDNLLHKHHEARHAFSERGSVSGQNAQPILDYFRGKGAFPDDFLARLGIPKAKSIEEPDLFANPDVKPGMSAARSITGEVDLYMDGGVAAPPELTKPANSLGERISNWTNNLFGRQNGAPKQPNEGWKPLSAVRKFLFGDSRVEKHIESPDQSRARTLPLSDPDGRKIPEMNPKDLASHAKEIGCTSHIPSSYTENVAHTPPTKISLSNGGKIALGIVAAGAVVGWAAYEIGRRMRREQESQEPPRER